MASRRPSRTGLFWTAVVLVAAMAGLDVARGPDSILRAGWNGLHRTRGDETRSLIDQFRRSTPRSRGR